MPQILMLHRVLPEFNSNNYYFQRNTAISWKRFVNLLDEIEVSGMHTLTVSALSKAPLRNSVFLTFDDGYADNSEALNEILRRGMVATLFPVKQFIQDDFSPIDDMAFQLMKCCGVSQELYSSLLEGRHKKLLRRMSFNKYRQLRKKLFSIAEDALPSGLFLTEHQLSDFCSKGIELGVHGVSHRIFTSLSNDALQQELNESRDWLISLGANKNLPICFPHGAHNQRIVDICLTYGSLLFGVDAVPSCSSVQRRTHIKEV